MYDYTYDAETGGILLNDKTALMSKEPRPVYAQELDFLGIDKIWNYQKQQDFPYMWAESNRYIYKGDVIFTTSGGSLYEKPTIEVTYLKDENGTLTKTQTLKIGATLEPVNVKVMCQKNREILDIIEQITVKKIYDIYKRYQKKLDCFHVAFSGGKDSIVLLELVKKALPRSSFMVIFGDTKMEFPDTYALVDKVEAQCKADGIDFYRAATHFKPEESWNLFGPPSRVLRWCCTVHKAAPQTLKIREVLKKNDFVGMDFVGVRAQESVARSNYDEENYGKKQKGQFSHNSILDWTSAEIWLYIFTHQLEINETYKKGNSRAGCLFCPMGGGKGDSFQYMSYPKEMDKYIHLVKSTNARDAGNQKALESYVVNGGWNARKNGRDLNISELHYMEEMNHGQLTIKVRNPSTDWHEWIKTLGHIDLDYSIEPTTEGYNVVIDDHVFGADTTLKRKFKQVFKKAAYCVGCRVCEMNCQHGRISFSTGLKIDNCLHCGQCHEIDSGCLVYNSLQMPQGGTKKMGSINSFANHAPKADWIKGFLSSGAEFWDNNSLGPNQVPMFKKFLRACGIINDQNAQSKIFDLLLAEGYESQSAWGLALTNLSYNPQGMWYVNNMPIGCVFSRDTIADMLIANEVSKGDATSIIGAFKRFSDLPLGTVLNSFAVVLNGKQVVSLQRPKSIMNDDRVLLYALYRYAEACEGYYQFSLRTLMDLGIESKGVSPVKIFGFERDEMEAILRGLAAKYHDFIDVTFTHDLDKITLRDYHTSHDVLGLF